MKPTPEERRVLERMAPGVLARDGFLGDDARPLSEILETDDRTVAALGTTHAGIADRMAEVLAQAAGGFGAPVEVGGGLVARFREGMGRIPSPWPGEGVFPKGEVELIDPASGETIRFTPLSVHLVRRHGFYQGRGSRYRLEPDRLARALGLA